jgi:uncharacterized protein HemX
MTDDPKKTDADLEQEATAAAPDEPPAAEAAPGANETPADESPPVATATAVVKPSRAGLAVGLLALLVAAVAVLGVAWLWLSSQGPDPDIAATRSTVAELQRQLQASEDRLRQSEQALADLRNAGNASSNQLDALQRTLNERLRPLEAVPGRLSNLESSLSALQGISSGLRDTWLLAEAEYYLQIANAQLQLAGNSALAKIALELADERLVSLGNPALTDVRRALADELRQLESLGVADTEGAVLTLASLAGAIDSLTLRNDVTEPDLSDPALDDELTGTARAWAALKGSLSNVISVRRSDQPVKPLLPPDAAYFLRSNLALQLQAARLALLRGEQALFQQSLDDAANWIAEYYDADSLPVQSALATINELRATEFRPAPPDISGSLALLRQFIARQSQRRQSASGSEQ